MSEILDSAWEVEEELLDRGSQILATVIQREFENGLPLVWEGKPVSALRLAFERDVAVGNQVVASETLEITPLLAEDAEGLSLDSDLIKHYGLEHLRANQALAAAAGRVLMTKGTNILDTIKYAPIDVRFGWWPVHDNDNTSGQNQNPPLFMSVYDGAESNPDMRLVASAKLFTEDVYDYVQSPNLILPLANRMQLAWQAGLIDEAIYHHLEPAMRVDLPLNGHESQGFLRMYAQKMDEGREKALGRLSAAQAITDDGNEFSRRLVEQAQRSLAGYDEAIAKVKRFLQDL